MASRLKNLPNCITVLRIIGTVGLLFVKPLTTKFYILYMLTGITDVLDGFLARKLNLTSNFGAKLDSVADLLFYAVTIILIMPVLFERLSFYIWIGVAVALTFRIAAYITAAIKFHRFASTHSYLNKITGLCVFSVPFFLLLAFAEPLCWMSCGIGILSSLHEFVAHLKSPVYKARKTIKT